MPGSPGQPAFEEHLTWTTISDFSQGVIQNANFANGPDSNLPVPALQPGAAQNAQNCIALPNGGLGPLPGVASEVIIADAPNAAYINGSLAYGPVGFTPNTPDGGDELLISYEAIQTGSSSDGFTLDDPVLGKLDGVGVLDGGSISTGRTWSLIGWQEITGIDFEVSSENGTSSAPAIQACSMIMTELNVDDPTVNGLPRVIFSHDTMGASSDSTILAMYPSWTTPQDGGVTDIADGPAVPAWLIGHQNRIVLLTQLKPPWTQTGTNLEYLSAAEYYNYTEPPNSATLGGQNENFVQEDPTPHGAWGSISASELFLVRQNGGGYVISGDLNVPTVTRLPGVTSTNGSVQVAAQTPIGLVYGSANNGVWVWNGGNTSIKMSNQLNDDFFMLDYDFTGTEVIPTGPFFNFNNVGDLIYCPNNWVYSITLNSWWTWTPNVIDTGTPFTLDSPTLGTLDGPGLLGIGGSGQSAPMAWFWPTFDGSGMWAFPEYIETASDPSAYKVSRLTPSNVYVWESYPMPFTKNRQVSIRQVAVRAQGDGEVTITFSNVDGGQASVTQPISFTIGTVDYPQLQQALAAARGPDITMSISAVGNNGGSAPIIYDISIGWEVGNEVNAM